DGTRIWLGNSPQHDLHHARQGCRFESVRIARVVLRPRQAGALIPHHPSRSPLAGEEIIMNLVKSILDQLSGNALDSLSTIAGADAETTRNAATAAVPSILSALTGMAGSDTGARKLASALEGLDTGGQSNLAKMLGGDGGSLVQKGGQL